MKRVIIFFLLLNSLLANSQILKPGFNKTEYINMMKISAQFGDSAYRNTLPVPDEYSLVYRSPVMGLDNRWDFWKSASGIGIISIRGTTANSISWLENFYAAMVPAKGRLQIGKDDFFDYELAVNPNAGVHVGWLIGTAFLSKDILSKIDSAYKRGMKEFIITGTSQGGAISFLVTAYLLNLQKQKRIDPAIRFKTYCNAAPKPGNLYFAYEYEAATQNGWAYSVINSADWVPETPFSVQTIQDFNPVNPFTDVSSLIKKQKFPKNIFLKTVYNKVSKPPKKTVKRYKKYLGGSVYKMIKKSVSDLPQPGYLNTSNYVRTGTTIVLLADEDYYRKFPQDPKKTFINHSHAAYLFLLDKLNIP